MKRDQKTLGVLTKKDREIILEQCILQNATSATQIIGFSLAYSLAKCWKHKVTSNILLELLLDWSSIIEIKNKNSFRKTPVVFQNGNSGIHWVHILGAMINLVEAIEDGSLNPEEAYKELELIHPFSDGNGRVGHLLWAMMTQWETGIWPLTLPPKIF